jgi:hypothetical protein
MKKFDSAILLSLTLVTSCDGIISLSSEVFSSGNLTIYERELTPDVPYVSENYQLPELSTNPFLLDVIWSTPA